MRLSQSLFVTWREAPQGADTPGTRALLRAGYIRKLSSGLYTHLPLMTRVQARLEALLREELANIAQEVSFPVLQPEALWQESGRWDAYTRAEGIMFTVRDRAGRDLALGPTHEEVAVATVRELARSARDLPVCLYQIGRKFRDELRPRFGLLRTREFVMKDAYSFHATPGDLARTYGAMAAAYGRVLDRLEVPWRAVEADSGAIGGAQSREFVVLADVGEDEVLYTDDGRYAANTERAEGRPAALDPSPYTAYARHHTPGTPTVESGCAALGCAPGHMVKNVLYRATFALGGDTRELGVLASLRGDDAVNEVKLGNAVQARADLVGGGTLIALEAAGSNLWADPDAVPLGYIAPDLPDAVLAARPGLHPRLLRLVDRAAADLRNFATGAGERDWHVTGANWGAQFALPDVVDLRQARAGEASAHDPGQVLHSARGIEVGHVFQLGTRYTAAMNYRVTGPGDVPQDVHMGCYGIGVTRLVQAVAEVCADERGLSWPAALAPHAAMLTVVDMGDAAQVAAGERLYAELRAAGLDVLLDDRPLRAGAKFADADLIGVPWRITLGRGISQGRAELRERRSGETAELALDDVLGALQEHLARR